MSKITIELLTDKDKLWFVEIAATNMIVRELLRPELLDLDQLHKLTTLGISAQTIFIAKDGDLCVGALAALPVPNILNPMIQTLVEFIWYVLPTHRQTRAGALLFSAFEQKGEVCADEATLSLLPHSKININTLEKRGFLLKEYAFHKNYRSI